MPIARAQRTQDVAALLSSLSGVLSLDAMSAVDESPVLIGDFTPANGPGSMRAQVRELRARQMQRIEDGSWRDDPMLAELQASDVEESGVEAAKRAAVVVEAQVMPFGDWAYPTWDGVDEFTIDRKFARVMVKNFKMYQRGGHEPFVTYGHPWDLGGTPADAWTVGLSHDGDSIQQQLKLLPETAEAIAGDRWRYYSATYHPAWRDEKGQDIGPTLLTGAITNFPFFTKMASLADGLESLNTQERERFERLLTMSRCERANGAEEQAMAAKKSDDAKKAPVQDPPVELSAETTVAELQARLEQEKTAREAAEKRATAAEAVTNDLGGRVQEIERRELNARIQDLVTKGMGLRPGEPMKLSRAFIEQHLPGYFDEADDAAVKALEASTLFGDVRALEAWLNAAPEIARASEPRLGGTSANAASGANVVESPEIGPGGMLKPTEAWALSRGFGPGKPGHREGETAAQHFERCQRTNRANKVAVPGMQSA